MQVKLIAITQYLGENESPIQGRSDTEALIEHAGRICYRSQTRGTANTTARFIQKRIAEGHESIIEHASASFEISGISRACSHQIVRHRIASYSQESQRYVDMSAPDWIIPPDIAADPTARSNWNEFLEQTAKAYRQLRARGIKKEDARFLLPNATSTRLIMTANLRELLHIFRLRISPHAQWEIREVSIQMLEAVYPYAPNVFGTLRSELQTRFSTFFPSVNEQEDADHE